MNGWLFVGALLAVVCVIAVSLPFLRRPGLSAAEDRLEETDAGRLALAEERDRALAALKELEFDHRTGKISDEDYRELVGALRRRAVETLRALQAVYGGDEDAAEPGRKQTGEPDGAISEKEAEMTTVAAEANERGQHAQLRSQPTAVVEPPQVPEPSPVPSETPGPVTVPEPSPVPSEPPSPTPSPDPLPEPSPPSPETPDPNA